MFHAHPYKIVAEIWYFFYILGFFFGETEKNRTLTVVSPLITNLSKLTLKLKFGEMEKKVSIAAAIKFTSFDKGIHSKIL